MANSIRAFYLQRSIMRDAAEIKNGLHKGKFIIRIKKFCKNPVFFPYNEIKKEGRP